MLGKRAAQLSGGQREPLGREAGEQGDVAPEHTGPVAIERLRKDDGRALILYSVDTGEQRVGEQRDEHDRGDEHNPVPGEPPA